MTTNRNFKDSVFTTLFSGPDQLRELYSALKGITLPADIPVSINTLEKVFFMDLINDISFEIGGKLVVLIEHQSTLNPNMAFRLLLYIARVLEKLFESRTLYSRKPVSIPWPEFFVLYNGKEEFPDERISKLSELFEKPADIGLPEEAHPFLELEVKIININEGMNEIIMNRCKKLAEYSVLVSRIHAFRKELGDLEEGIKKAIQFCHVHGILKEYLETHGAEVLNMILTEWNTEDAIAVARDEGLEKGREENRIENARKALEKGLAPEIIQEITGLDIETINLLNKQSH